MKGSVFSRKLTMEFFGTFMLTGAVVILQSALSVGFVLASLILIGGHVSGAHYNPSVTFAMWIRKQIEPKLAVSYVVVQLGAAVAGAKFFGLMRNGDPKVITNAASYPLALGAEVIGTFILVAVILALTQTKQFAGNKIYPYAIGLTIAGLGELFGFSSGGSFNPAVAMGINAVGGLSITGATLYVLGPVLGAALAAILNISEDLPESS